MNAYKISLAVSSVLCALLQRDVFAILILLVCVEVWVIICPVVLFWIMIRKQGGKMGEIVDEKDYRKIRNMCPDMKYYSVWLDLKENDWRVSLKFPDEGYCTLAFYDEKLRNFHVENSKSEMVLTSKGSGMSGIECPSRFCLVLFRSLIPTITEKTAKQIKSSFKVSKTPRQASGFSFGKLKPLLLLVPFMYFSSLFVSLIYSLVVPLTIIVLAGLATVKSNQNVNGWVYTVLKMDESNWGHLATQLVGPLALSKKETFYYIFHDTLDANKNYRIKVPKALKEVCYWCSVTAVDSSFNVFTKEVEGEKFSSSELSIAVSKDKQADIVIPAKQESFNLVLRCYRPSYGPDGFNSEVAPTVKEDKKNQKRA